MIGSKKSAISILPEPKNSTRPNAKAIYAKTQQLAQENLPFIYLINSLALSAVRNDFQGIQYTALGGVTWNIHDIQEVRD